MKIALIAMDRREDFREQQLPAPSFGAATDTLLQGFAALPDLEVHVISCVQKPLPAPEKLADNTWFHSLYVPKMGWARTKYQGCLRTVRRCLKMIRPDMVHGLETERECGVCAAFSRFPNVLTSRGKMPEMARISKAPMGSVDWLAAQLEDIALQRTFGVICNSEDAEKLVQARAKKIWLVPCTVREGRQQTGTFDLAQRHLEIYREVLSKDS